MDAYEVFLFCAVSYLTVVSGHTIQTRSKEILVPEAVKEYVTNAVSESEDKHSREIQVLNDKIDSQKKQIDKLEADKVVFQSVITELGERISSLEAAIGTYNNSNESGDLSQAVPWSSFGNLSADGANKCSDISSAGMLGTKLGNERRIRRAVTEGRVAFSVSMTQDQIHLGQGQDIVFNHVITNIGNAYNENHGTFLAPVAGTYVFYFSLHSPGARADLVVNGQVVTNLYIGNDQASQLALVTLKQGDDVSVQNLQPDKLFWGSGYSTFSGFLLYDVIDGSQVVG